MKASISINKEIIGEKIKNLRLKRFLTMRDLGKEIHASVSQISKWENGQNVPNLPHVINICNFFEISIDYLIISTHDLDH